MQALNFRQTIYGGWSAMFFAFTCCLAQDSLNVTQIALMPFYGETADHIVVQGGYGYVAGDEGYNDVLKIINLANPSAPTIIGTCENLHEVYDMVIDSVYIFSAAGYDGLELIDVSNPSLPVALVTWDPSDFYPYTLAIQGNFLYLAGERDYNSSVYVLDISDPFEPVELGHCSTGEDYPSATDMAVANALVYVALDGIGLGVVDVSNPSAPGWISSCETPAGAASELDVSGDYVYITCGGAGLRVIDVSNSLAPVEEGYWDPLNVEEVDGVVVSGNHAYVAVDEGGDLRVLDLTDPDQPEEVGYYRTPGYLAGMAIQGNYVYVADYYYFDIYDCAAAQSANPLTGDFTEPLQSMILSPPHPNPFNPSTVISFELRASSYVTLEVFDIRGERVGTGLVPVQWYPTGAHQITFDGSNLPSGLYFAKLTTGDFSQVQKLVLLK